MAKELNIQWFLTWDDVIGRLERLGLSRQPYENQHRRRQIYGVPRGGAIVAGLTQARFPQEIHIVSDPSIADMIVDDIIDSGSTQSQYAELYPDKPFIALVDKPAEGLIGKWIKFPWEHDRETDLEDHVRRIIQAIGDDPSREGLLETPRRLAQSWQELFSGYADGDPASVLKWFESESQEMVIMRDISFWSTCEHHMLPFWGKVDIGYIPNGKVIGISKLSRLVNAISRRLQIQENLTHQIGKSLEGPFVDGVGVSVRAQHACMMARGVRQSEGHMVTNYMSGDFLNNPATRAEFLGR